MRRIFNPRGRESAGFTLLELLITLVLVFIMTGTVFMVYDIGFRTFYSQEKRSSLKNKAAQAAAALSGDLRRATSLTSAQAAALTLTQDTDADGVDESIQYAWSGTAGADLVRVAAATVPVAFSVQSVSFSYYDSNENLLSFPVTASQARRVVFDMTVSSAAETFRIRSAARLRSL